MIVPRTEPSPEVHKPDTSAALLHQKIWYRDTGRPSLWRTRAGDLLDTAVLTASAQGEKDFYADVLNVVQIVFPLDPENFCIRVRTVGSAG